MGPVIPFAKAENLAGGLIERLSRRSMSSEERQARDRHLRYVEELGAAQTLSRHANIDTEVITKASASSGLWYRAPTTAMQRLRNFTFTNYFIANAKFAMPAI